MLCPVTGLLMRVGMGQSLFTAIPNYFLQHPFQRYFYKEGM